jgi:penicillin-binding protein 1A
VPQVRQQPAVAEVKSKSGEPQPPPRPALLTKRGADILVRVERMMDDANRALGPATPKQPAAADAGGKRAEVTSNADTLATSLEGRAFGNHN